MKKIVVLCALMSCLAFDLIGQTTWYISTTGSDLNSGTSSGSAFASVNRAFSVAACGDSIYILGGTYHQKINTYAVCPDNNRIKIQGDISNRPLIIGDSTVTNKYAIGASGSGFTFRHLELTSPYPDVCDPSNMVVAGSGNDMSFIDLIIRNSGYDGMKTTSDCSTNTWANNWKVIDCQIINNGLGCPSSIQNGDGIDFTNCHDCEITGTSILNNRGHQVQIKLEARNVTVENCRIEGIWMFQIGLPGSSPQCDTAALNADSVFFRRNVIIAKGDTSEFIFRLADVSHLVIENNTIIKDSISSANVGFICFGGCAGSVDWLNTPTSPVVIRNNIFANMSAPFLFGADTSLFDPFHVFASQITMDYNLFYDINGDIIIPPDSGANSLVAAPLWCNYPVNLNLQTSSPCINAGDPASPNDPDNSRNDIGAFYYKGSCTAGINIEVANLPGGIVFPNPATDEIHIDIGNEKIKSVKILGADGTLLREYFTSEFSISKFPYGLYFIITQTDKQIFINKLIKQ